MLRRVSFCKRRIIGRAWALTRLVFDLTPAMGSAGGIPRYLLELLRALRALPEGLKVQPWAAGLRHRRARTAALACGRVGGPPLPQGWLRRLWALGVPLGTCSPDAVFHATTPSCPPPGRAGLVVTVHDLAPLDGPEWFPAPERAEFSAWLRRAVQRADRLVVPSEFSRARLSAWFPSASPKTEVIPHGVDHAWPAPRAPGCLRDGRGGSVRIEPPFLLVVGTLQPRKGLERLVRAMEGSHLPLVLAGRRGWLFDRLFRQASASPAWQRLWFHETPEDAELVWLYRSAAALVQASPYEGFGFPPLEAASFGLPVCALPGTPLDGFVHGEYWKLPEDVDRWSDVFASLVAGGSEVSARIEAARKHVQRLRWDVCAQSMLEVYGRARQAARSR